jgi:hypothetical protein
MAVQPDLATLIAAFWQAWTPAFRARDDDPDLRELDSAAFLRAFFIGARLPVTRTWPPRSGEQWTCRKQASPSIRTRCQLSRRYAAAA